jgi:hypothetical protein
MLLSCFSHLSQAAPCTGKCAAQRPPVEGFLESGDLDGCAVWKRVLKAIKEIRREEPREGEAVN